MGLLAEVLNYMLDNQGGFSSELRTHLRLSVSALSLAILLFAPLGVLAANGRAAGQQLVSIVAAARVVPSLAILFLMLPLVGTGFTPALIALTLLAGPPLIVNTDAGLRGVDPAVLENARGLGMNRWQVFSRVQFPLALPVVIAGIRTAAVEVIASATLAAFIGAGGLGRFILSGMTLVDSRLLLVGALPVALMALAAEIAFHGLERVVSQPRA